MQGTGAHVTEPAKPPAASERPLKVVEIGGDGLFVLGAPAQTAYYWTGLKPRDQAKNVLGPVNFIRLLLALRRGEADLLVVHATQYPPWHPRSFLTALRDWHVRAPVGLFAAFAWRFVHLFHKVPIAVIDLGDSCLIGRHNFFLFKFCKIYFKRELPSDHWLVFCRSGYPNFPGRRWRSKPRFRRMVEKLRPISYGSLVLEQGHFAQVQPTAAPEKKVDIFFAGTIAANSTARVVGLQDLRALEREGFRIDIPNERLSPAEFFKRMSAAWLAWSPSGLGWECHRHYEAPMAGTVPLINHPTILRDMPLRDGEHCVLYPVEPGGLAQAARLALADKPRLRAMAQAAAAHVARHHSAYARADRVAALVLGRRLDGSRIESV